MKNKNILLKNIANDMCEIKTAIDSRDNEIRILKELVLELKKCNDLLLRENLKFKEVMNYKTYLR